jgi:G:T-mismatch repair DNA endonuclease (very short patch repair protein)
VALFVDGCFWHGCPKHATMPANNRTFWRAKFTRNAQRDRDVTRALRKAGWRVMRVWECALARRRESATARRIARAIGTALRECQSQPASAPKSCNRKIHPCDPTRGDKSRTPKLTPISSRAKTYPNR